jgi:hypothetical protein
MSKYLVQSTAGLFQLIATWVLIWRTRAEAIKNTVPRDFHGMKALQL